MTDDLVKRLDAEINATYGKHPCGLLNEAKMRIERLETEVRMTATYDRLMQKLADDQAQRIDQLETALEKHAAFIVKHDLWEVFVAALKEKRDGI
jgi:ABC-type Na+ transport system ATPase subunit NatA